MKDKILFWINGFLLHFAISYYLQKNYDADYYSVIDISNKPKKFFQKQDLVKFEKTWFYHDSIKKLNREPDLNYLNAFENKYGINLWKLAINERIFYKFNRLYKFTNDEILLILEQECKLFENILDSIKPDFFITVDPFLHHNKLLYDLCRAKGVKVLGLYIARIGTKCIITDNGTNFGLKDLSEVKEQNRNFEELRKYQKTFSLSKIVKNYLDGRLVSTTNQLKAINDFVLHSDGKNMQSNYFYFGRNKTNVLIDALKFSLKRKYRNSFINKNLESNVNFKRNFIYFPLAVDEEHQLLNFAPFYTNQTEVIRHVAKSIPINYQLFVKEHPGQQIRGWKSISEYKEIMQIPNVHLLHPSISHEKLFEYCSLVITIRGTAGLSATFYEKPVITFADVPESVLPSIQKLNSLDELPKLIRNSLSIKVQSSDLDKFLTWIESNSFDFNILGYEIMEKQYFYPGGILVDIEIQNSKMKSFLNENQSIFEILVKEFLKKINESNIINSPNYGEN